MISDFINPDLTLISQVAIWSGGLLLIAGAGYWRDRYLAKHGRA